MGSIAADDRHHPAQDGASADGKTRAITITDPSHGRRDQVPLVGYVAAGAPILAQENIEEYLTFDTGGLTGCLGVNLAMAQAPSNVVPVTAGTLNIFGS